MRISLTNFRGIAPKLAADLLAGSQAQTAENVKLSNGQLRAWDNELLTQLLANKGTVRTIYLHEGAYWLEWEADVDIIRAPVSGDTAGKIYFTGDGIPKKTNTALATTGSGPMPIDFYPLGLPSPKHALAAVPSGVGGSGDDRAITYVWTLLSDWGEESIPSPASTVADAMNGETVALTGMTLVWQAATTYAVGESVYAVGDEGVDYLYKCVVAGMTAGVEPPWGTEVDGDTIDGGVTWRCYRDNIASKNIYRYNTGNEYGNFELVTTIAVTATTYDDSTEDDDLGVVLPSETWDPPLSELSGLTFISNGIIAGFVGKDLYFCEAYRPWTFPTAHMLSLESTIVSIEGVGAGTAVVTTEGRPYLVTGTDPASMTPIRLPSPKACVSKRGTVAYGTGAIYPAADGLVVINAEQADVITKNHVAVKEWAEFYPATLHGYVHDDKYFGFYNSGGNEGGLVLDLISGEFTTLSFYAPAAYVDPQTDTLYFVKPEDECLLLETGDYLLLETGSKMLRAT